MINESNSEKDDIDNLLVEALLDSFGQLPKDYVASSKELIDGSNSYLPRTTMDEIFKSKSQYYPQLKLINIPIKHDVVHITPSVARDMLEFSRRGAINKGLKNRNVNQSTVKRYRKDMDDRKWCLTGQPIIIGHDGEILDGHSRLEAASKSSVGFIAVLAWGISDQLSFAHIDVGNIRSRAQVLQMDGVEVNVAVASQVALLSQCFDHTKNKYAFRGTQGNKFQQAETVEYVRNNEELLRSVAFTSPLLKKYKQEVQASEATYAFAHYLIKRQLESSNMNEFPITPESYLTKIMSGIGINSEDDIEYQVRNYLQTLVGESTSYSMLCRLSAIFKGWNLYVGIPVYGHKIAVRRVAKFIKDDMGNKLPAKGAGNIKEAFTVPFMERGKTPLRVKNSAAVKIV